MANSVAFSSFQVGAQFEPLPVQSPNTLLFDADPALYYAIDFWTFLINTYPGPRFLQACTEQSLRDQQGNVITSAVGATYPYMPTPVQLESQLKLPLLAAWRTRTVSELKTAGWEHDGGHVEVMYVLPPMTAGQTENIVPILNAVEKTLRQKTTYGFDPGYAPPGGKLGQQPWAPLFAHVEYIGFGDPYTNRAEIAEYGNIEGSAGNLYFPSIKMRAFLLERDTYVPSPNKFAGADITANLVAPDATVIPSFVQVSTQQAPTITSVSPNNGAVAGGTPVTINGTLFLSGATVMFGMFPATNVVTVSSTQITCVTPAYLNPGAISVVVINRDGQATTAPFSFM